MHLCLYPAVNRVQTVATEPMLHIATVHWQNEDWIDIQLSHLKRHIPVPHRVYAFLNGVPVANRAKFFYASLDPIREHASKLNILADIIVSKAADDRDLIMFLDGDAFPIADLMPMLADKLAKHPLVAVQRLENNGDRQPHPCFCVTTVGFWRTIAGDWREGHTWADRAGNPVTDVGGNLLGILEARKIEWSPLLRSNRTNLHPLWFGIYGGAVYHHGAGFRKDKLSRADLAALAEERGRGSAPGRAAADMLDYVLRRSPLRALRKMTRAQREDRRVARLSDEFFERVKSDEHFYRVLME
jgi:hypothetical protein